VDGETTYRPAELARQVGLTFQHRCGDGLRLRIDAYRRVLTDVQPRYENLFDALELFPETESDRVLVDPERSVAKGVEILVRGEPGGSFHWWSSYAWASAEDVVDGRRVPRDWDQTHTAKFLVAWHLGRTSTLSLAGTIHTGWPTTPISGELTTLPDGSVEVDPLFGPRNSDRFSTYSRLDLKVGREIALSRGRLRLELDVVNITNRKNVCCVDDYSFVVLPGDTVETRRYFDRWLGVTPSFNAAWEF